MQRRELLRSGMLAVGSAVSAGAQLHAAEPAPISLVPARYETFDEWLAAARPATLSFLATPQGREPERFVRYLLLWAAAMPRPAVPDQMWQATPGARERLELAMVAPGRPFVVSLFRMAPGCLLPAHCHPGGGGVTLCLEGTVDIQHFNLVEGSPAFSETGKRARVRLDSITHLPAERYTLFTPERSNLHQLRAGPGGAIGLDLAVQWQGGGEFSFLRFESERASDAANVGATLQGKWTGMSIADAYA